jgi:putative transcriptional regulator
MGQIVQLAAGRARQEQDSEAGQVPEPTQDPTLLSPEQLRILLPSELQHMLEHLREHPADKRAEQGYLDALRKDMDDMSDDKADRRPDEPAIIGAARATLRTVRELRAEHGWSQAHLAEKADVSEDRVSNIERNKVVPSLLVAQRIARALGVSTDDIAWPDETTVERPAYRTRWYLK